MSTRVLEAAIEKSGLSARRFAERIIGRDERTVRYWLAEKYTIPPVVLRWLEAYVEGELKVSGPYVKP